MRNFKKKGQTLVEFTLVLTLIFFMLAGLIDFGLAFFAYQGISGAAQEGATYAAMSGSLSEANAEIGEIRHRVINEGGLDQNVANRARFVNLFDLNSDKVTDNDAVWETHILFRVVASDLIDRNTRPTDWQNQTNACRTRIQTQWCSTEVEVLYDYKAIFPAAKLFMGTDKITLRAARRMTVSR